MAADEGFDDDGPEFRAPLPPEDRVWRHPAELGAMRAVGTTPAEPAQRSGRSPWTVGFVSVIGGVLLAGSLMFGAGGVGDEPGRIALRPIATLAPRDSDDPTARIAAPDAPPAPRSVVGVDVQAPDDVRIGNGIVVQAPGYVVTTASLVADELDIRVTDEGGAVHAATVVGVDQLNDLALLHVPRLTTPVAALDPEPTAHVGQAAHVFGASRGAVASSRMTTIAAIDARLAAGACDLHGALQLTDTLDVTSAGAPLVGAQGDILGLVTTLDPAKRTVAVPVRTIARAASQLVTAGAVQHGWLGVEGVTAPAEAIETLAPAEPDNTPGTAPEPGVRGVLVSRVVDRSPAQLAGITANDLVIAVDGEQVPTMSSLVIAVRERQPGTIVTVTVLRNDERHDVPVALTDAPAPV